jgi:ketosteroid isomerase-like protein
MSAENIAWAQRLLEHFAATGEPYMEDVALDVEVFDWDIPDARNPYVGHDGLVAWLVDFGESWSSYELGLERLVDAGDRVVALMRLHAVGAASGVELERDDALVWTFRGDQMVRIDYFNSHAHGLEAAGATE